MAKVFGAEGSGFVSEEKKKNGSYLGKRLRKEASEENEPFLENFHWKGICISAF